MVRMIYFLHDVSADQGPFCVVPGSHKSNFPSPYRCGPDEEPGMVGSLSKRAARRGVVALPGPHGPRVVRRRLAGGT